MLFSHAVCVCNMHQQYNECFVVNAISYVWKEIQIFIFIITNDNSFVVNYVGGNLNIGINCLILCYVTIMNGECC